MMAKEKKKVPNLRFKGFTDDWEQRKLGNIGKARSGVGFPNKEQGGRKGIPFFKVSDMNNQGNEFEMVTSNNYVTATQILTKKWKPISKVPAVIFAKVGAALMLNRKRLVKTPFLIDNNTMAYIFDRKWDPYFGKNLFDTLYLPKYAQTGALPSFNGSDIESIQVMLPSLGEQQRISQVFKIINNLISLQQRKLELLKQLKKGLLQKMFADKDSKQPVLRFKGFHDDWEQRRLGEVAEIKTGSRNHQDSVDNGKYPFFIRSEKVERLNEYDFDTKAILVPGDGRIGEIFHYYDGKFALHQRVYKVDNFKEVNPLYLLNLFKYKFKKHALRLNAQGTVPSLRLPMFTNWNILIPNLNEQQKIGLFFQQLDSLITLQQRKQNHLKLLKKSLLQQMFM